MNNQIKELIQHMYLTFKKLPLSYNGSKKKLFRWIAPLLIQELQDADVILDGFSGTGIISAFLSLNGYKVYANDILYSSYVLTSTLSQNPGEIINEDDLSFLSSHRCIDGIIFENEKIYDNIENNIQKKYPNILTTNESSWIEFLNNKISVLSPYKQFIAHSAIRGISTIIPFNTANGTKKFQNRIKQKDNYGQRCLGFYYNSSYEIEYVKWFQNYVKAFNNVVTDFSSHRTHNAIVYQDDIFNILNKNIKFDAAYFDPPYGRKNRIGYDKLYTFQEDLLQHKMLPHSIFTNPEDHCLNFKKLLEACCDIPKIIFSYDTKSWATIEEISLICKSFGRTIKILSTEHCHGKIPMDSHNTKVFENLIVAIKK